MLHSDGLSEESLTNPAAMVNTRLLQIKKLYRVVVTNLRFVTNVAIETLLWPSRFSEAEARVYGRGPLYRIVSVSTCPDKCSQKMIKRFWELDCGRSCAWVRSPTMHV